MSLRWDKYLWCVRLAKTRTQATELFQKGKVLVNDSHVKPSREPKIGDVIAVLKNNAVFTFKVVALLDKRVGAKLVTDYLSDITPEEEIEKYRQYQLAQSAYRNYGTGKPSKKDRRDIETFMDDWE
jgi:ribosome-associated heat shock protein Hsp15